jgi:hypothetical protein
MILVRYFDVGNLSLRPASNEINLLMPAIEYEILDTQIDNATTANALVKLLELIPFPTSTSSTFVKKLMNGRASIKVKIDSANIRLGEKSKCTGCIKNGTNPPIANNDKNPTRGIATPISSSRITTRQNIEAGIAKKNIFTITSEVSSY